MRGKKKRGKERKGKEGKETVRGAEEKGYTDRERNVLKVTERETDR